MRSTRRALARIVLPGLTLALVGASAYAAPGARPARIPDGDWTRFGFTAARTDVGPARTGITARNLGSLRSRVVQLDGTADSSPIELAAVKVRGRRQDVIFVTTTYGRTLAISPRTGKRLWEFTPKDIASYQGTAQITTASPVADPGRRYIYAASPDGFIHKLSVATGHQVWATEVASDPSHQKIASALNISGSSVVVTTGGYIGDIPPYQGHVVLIDRASGRRTHVWNSLCSHRTGLIHRPGSCPASDSAIWGRAGAVVEPHSGRILVATGNGPFNGSSDWGDSVLELSPTLKPLRHWTPRDEYKLDHDDLDLGSVAPALLPDGLAVQGGKAGVLSLLSLKRLSPMRGSGGHHLGGELQDTDVPGKPPMFSAAAVWTHSSRTYVFVGTLTGTWAYVLGSNERLHLAWRRATPGTSPVLAGGLLYVFDQVDGRLNIRSPTTGKLLGYLPAAPGHWNSPIVIGGRIVLPVGTANSYSTTGKMFIYHLPGR